MRHLRDKLTLFLLSLMTILTITLSPTRAQAPNELPLNEGLWTPIPINVCQSFEDITQVHSNVKLENCTVIPANSLIVIRDRAVDETRTVTLMDGTAVRAEYFWIEIIESGGQTQGFRWMVLFTGPPDGAV